MPGRFGPGQGPFFPPDAGPAPAVGFGGLVAVAMAVTAVTNLSPLLSSGLAVQIQGDLDFDDAALGLTVGAFYLAGALGSVLSGRIVERVGPRAALRFTALATAGVLLATGAAAGSWAVLTGLVGLAGLANALAQPATNLYIARGVRPGRQGLAIGVQKSGIPAAALLGGLAVPTLGLTVGWSWAFVIGALLALAASAYVPSVPPKPERPAEAGAAEAAASLSAAAEAATGPPAEAASGQAADGPPADGLADGPPAAQAEDGSSADGPSADGSPGGPRTVESQANAASARPDVPTRLLAALATATGLAAAGSGSLSGFFVVSSVGTGVDEGMAGFLLGAGSLVGIAVRLILGAMADRGAIGAWNTLTVMFLVAAASFGGLATGSEAVLIAVLPFAFATAFAWPSLYHLAVVRANPSAPGAATGITMTGSYTGAVGGPLVFGLVADFASYGWAWGVAVVFMAAAAAVMTVVGRFIDDRREGAP